jgi:hypothetical protein
VHWQVTDYQLDLTPEEELVRYAAKCTASCEKSLADGPLPEGLGERSQWEPRYWPRA